MCLSISNVDVMMDRCVCIQQVLVLVLVMVLVAVAALQHHRRGCGDHHRCKAVLFNLADRRPGSSTSTIKCGI